MYCFVTFVYGEARQSESSANRARRSQPMLPPQPPKVRTSGNFLAPMSRRKLPFTPQHQKMRKQTAEPGAQRDQRVVPRGQSAWPADPHSQGRLPREEPEASPSLREGLTPSKFREWLRSLATGGWEKLEPRWLHLGEESEIIK